jgi:hypothetical protein
MNILIKQYFDSYRRKRLLPPEIDGKVDGRLFDDEELLKKWRHWRAGLRFEDTVLNVALESLMLRARFITLLMQKGSE